MSRTTQQEILLITGTSFLAAQSWQKNSPDKQDYSEAELLEEACCNGMLPEILPEIFSTSPKQRLYLWQVRENKCGLGIELGEFPEIKEKHLSIDPYSFFYFQPLN